MEHQVPFLELDILLAVEVEVIMEVYQDQALAVIQVQVEEDKVVA